MSIIRLNNHIPRKWKMWYRLWSKNFKAAIINVLKEIKEKYVQIIKRKYGLNKYTDRESQQKNRNYNKMQMKVPELKSTITKMKTKITVCA